MFGHRSKTDTHTQTDPVCLISDPIHPTCKMVLFNAGTAGTVCACCFRCWIFLCFDVRHWFRSSRRLASVRGWRWTGHRCIGIERCPYKVVGLVTLMTCLCRYKVLLLKPHLRDMLASARRQRAFMGFPCFFHDQMIFASDVSNKKHMKCAKCDSTDDEIGRTWRNLHLLKAATEHREKAGILKLCGTGMMNFTKLYIDVYSIFGSSWTCYVSLSAGSSRVFNQSPAHLRQSLDQTCFQTMRDRHGLRISR